MKNFLKATKIVWDKDGLAFAMSIDILINIDHIVKIEPDMMAISHPEYFKNTNGNVYMVDTITENLSYGLRVTSEELDKMFGVES